MRSYKVVQSVGCSGPQMRIMNHGHLGNLLYRDEENARLLPTDEQTMHLAIQDLVNRDGLHERELRIGDVIETDFGKFKIETDRNVFAINDCGGVIDDSQERTARRSYEQNQT